MKHPREIYKEDEQVQRPECQDQQDVGYEDRNNTSCHRSLKTHAEKN